MDYCYAHGGGAVHSISLLAKKDFKEIGIIGLGNTARAMLSILAELYPMRELKIKLKIHKDQHILFAQRFSNITNFHFEFCETYEEVIENSDVVVSAATYFAADICEDKFFKEGCLIVPIHTRGFSNCDLFFDKVFADDTDHVRSFKYFNKFQSFAEVADIVMGRNAGRENDQERIIVYNIGIALHDLYFAKKIYQLYMKNLGKHNDKDISLKTPTDKFWL